MAMRSKNPEKAAVTVIGAGVIGLAVAAAVAVERGHVYVLEKNAGLGRETSSRSSETIHAGIYYPAGSLKATTCVEGNRLLYGLSERSGVPTRRTGKLIVARNSRETDALEALLELGKENRAEGLRLLTREQMQDMEPNVEGRAALYSPSSGVMDSYALMQHFLASAVEGGAEMVLSTEVVGIERSREGYAVTIRDADGEFEFVTEMLVNCAGLNADTMAQAAGIDIDEAGYRTSYCKGDYFNVGNGKSRLVSRLVYPVPDAYSGGLGIHNVFDIGGRMRVGPGATHVERIDYSVDENQRQFFLESVKGFLPFLELGDLEPDMAGIRPKLGEAGDWFRDFVIRDEKERGLPGLINLVGIESPGLTSSPAIGRMVADMVKEAL